MSAFTSAIGELRSVVVYSRFLIFRKRLKKACSRAKCKTLWLSEKKVVSFFRKSQNNRWRSSDNVLGESTFSLTFSYPYGKNFLNDLPSIGSVYLFPLRKKATTGRTTKLSRINNVRGIKFRKNLKMLLTIGLHKLLF